MAFQASGLRLDGIGLLTMIPSSKHGPMYSDVARSEVKFSKHLNPVGLIRVSLVNSRRIMSDHQDLG